jgi:prolyl 4-hydroxylase
MASSSPKLSTFITWLLYFVPVYIFVLDPLTRSFFPGNSSSPSWDADQGADTFEEWDHAPSTLHLTDDSFISPEDGVPANCPGEAEGYRVHLLSRAPLVLYIENFVSAAEADHLVDIRYLPRHFPYLHLFGRSKKKGKENRKG